MAAKEILETVKETVIGALKAKARRKYREQIPCEKLCKDMQDWLDLCEQYLQSEENLTAFETTAYILVLSVKVEDDADSNVGMSTKIAYRAYKLMEQYTKKIIKTKEQCEDLDIKKLEKMLDNLIEEIEDKQSIQYMQKEDWEVRYLLRRQLLGKEAVRPELYEHLYIDELRLISIKDACEEQEYDEAESLCIRKAKKESGRQYQKDNPWDWNNLLFDIYKASNNTKSQIEQAHRLLLFGNERFWDVLKELYQKKGTWDEMYLDLLDEMKNSKAFICYRGILIKENEKKRLLEDLINNSYGIFYYGKFLVKDYPTTIYDLCHKVISSNCTQAKTRREYKEIASQITQLIKWKGYDKAEDLIEELKQRYTKKPALQDELKKVEKSIHYL